MFDLYQLAFSLLIALVTAIATATIALKHFYKQELWLRKEEKYSEIVEKMSVLMNYFKWAIGEEIDPRTSEEDGIKYYREYKEIRKEIEVLRFSEGFIINFKVTTVLRELISNLQRIENEAKHFFEIFDNSSVITITAINDIIQIANKDLKVMSMKDMIEFSLMKIRRKRESKKTY